MDTKDFKSGAVLVCTAPFHEILKDIHVSDGDKFIADVVIDMPGMLGMRKCYYVLSSNGIRTYLELSELENFSVIEDD